MATSETLRRGTRAAWASKERSSHTIDGVENATRSSKPSVCVNAIGTLILRCKSPETAGRGLVEVCGLMLTEEDGPELMEEDGPELMEWGPIDTDAVVAEWDSSAPMS